MRCDRCTRTDRAIFAPMLYRDAYAGYAALVATRSMPDISITCSVSTRTSFEGPEWTSNRQPYLGRRFFTRLMTFTALVLGKRLDPCAA